MKSQIARAVFFCTSLAILCWPRLAAPGWSATAGPLSGPGPLTVAFGGPSGAAFYEWQFDFRGGVFTPDYVSEISPTVSYTYQAAGSYTARLRYFDASTGLPTDQDVTISVLPPPTPPVVTLTIPAEPPYPLPGDGTPTSPGTPVSLMATATPAAGETVSTFQWDFDGDGIIDAVTPAGAPVAGTYTSSTSHIFSKLAAYNVVVKAVDSQGLVGSDQKTVKTHAPPIVSIVPVSIEPYPYQTGTPLYSAIGLKVGLMAVVNSGPWAISSYSWSTSWSAFFDPAIHPNSDPTQPIFTLYVPPNVVGGLFPYVYLTVKDELDGGVVPAGSGSTTVAVRFGSYADTHGNPIVPGQVIPLPFVSFWNPASDGSPLTFYSGAIPPTPETTLVFECELGNSLPFFSQAIMQPYGYGLTLATATIPVPKKGSTDMHAQATDSAGAYYGAITNVIGMSNTPVAVSLEPQVNGVSSQIAQVGDVVTFKTKITSPDGQTIGKVQWDYQNDGFADLIEDFSMQSPPLSTVTVTDATYQYETPGTYQVQVQAGAGTDLLATVYATITVTPRTGPLECWMTQPPTGVSVWGNHVTLRALAAPGALTRYVDFSYRPQGSATWKFIGRVSPPPSSSLTFTWDATQVIDPASPTTAVACDLQAVSTDINGNTSSSWSLRPVTITVDPNITFTAPLLEGQPVATTVELVDSNGMLSKSLGIDPNQPNRCDIAHDVAVELPPGAVSAYCVLQLERPLENPHLAEARAQNLTFVPGTFRTLSLGNAPLQAPSKVSLYDVKESVGTFLASEGFNAENAATAQLTIYRFEPPPPGTPNGRWVPLTDHVRQVQEDLLRASMTAMGDIGLVVENVPARTGTSGSSSSGCGLLGVEGLLALLLLDVIGARRFMRTRR